MTVRDEQHVQNLPFEIIAEAQNNLNIKSSNENNPLNYKIRIKSKKERKIKQAIISVPKLNISQRSKNLRLVNSDQTIMSFDVFVDPHSDKNPPKKREKFFLNIFKPGCLMQNDVDDVPYMPCASHNTNEMQNEYNENLNDWPLDITEKFALRKNIIPADNTTNAPKTFFGKSKAGGCLDPPFSEDKYAYKPTSIPNTKGLSSDISKTSIENNKNKSEDSSLYSQISKKIRDSVISDSLITYPQDLSTSNTKNFEENQNISIEQTSNNTRLFDNEFTELYYMPQKKTQLKKFEEHPNKKFTDHNALEKQDEITTPIEDISLLSSSEIKMTKPEIINEKLHKDHKSHQQIIGEIASDDNKKTTDNKNRLYTSLEQKEIKIGYISRSDSKIIIDTIGVTEGNELELLSVTIKEPLDEPINNCNVENEKIALRESQNSISLNSSMDVNNKSKDLLARNMKLGYEYDISTKKSHEIDEARKIVHSKQSNLDLNQFSSSLGVFDKEYISEVQLSDENDLLARNLNLGYEYVISTKKSHEIDEARKIVHSKQSNIDLNQFSSSLGVFDKEYISEVLLSDENGNTFDIQEAKIALSSKEKILEKSNDEHLKPIHDKNIEYIDNNDEYIDNNEVKKNEIEQSPKRSLQIPSNAEIIRDVKVAEKLSMKSNDTQHFETPSIAFLKEIKNKHSASENSDTYDQNIGYTDGHTIEEDMHSTQINNRTENDIIDISNTASLKIKQDTISEVNVSVKDVHSKISKSEEFKNEYSTINKQKDKVQTSAVEGDVDVQESSTEISTSKISEDIFSEKSYKSSNTKKSRSENLSMLNESKNQNEKFYNIGNDEINNEQSTLSQQLKNTSRNFADSISNESQHRHLRSSMKSESLTNTDFKGYEAFVDLTKKDFNGLKFDKNTLHKYDLTNNSSVIKGYTSPSLYSIKASKDVLQKNVNAAHSNIFTSNQDTIDIKSDKVKLEYLDFSPSSTEMLQNRQKNTDDFMAFTNGTTNNTILLEKKNDVNHVELAGNISNKDSYSKSIGTPSSIALNLDFHISNNKHNNISIKTYDPMLPPEKHIGDKFVSTKCVVTETNKEIKIPITSEVDFVLSIKKNTRSRKIFNQTKDIYKTISEGNIKYNSLLHDTLNSVYNNLLPLKEIINGLRQEIKLLSQQQIQFIELLNKMETKPLRLINIDQGCTCQTRTLPDMLIHYG